MYNVTGNGNKMTAGSEPVYELSANNSPGTGTETWNAEGGVTLRTA